MNIMTGVNVIELTRDNFAAETTNGVCLVDFWAPWCGPCRMLGPVIDEIAAEMQGKAKICKLNIDDHGEVASQFGIQAVPTILLFKNGKLMEQLVGMQQKSSIVEMINGLL